jgi:hypothetical protein
MDQGIFWAGAGNYQAQNRAYQGIIALYPPFSGRSFSLKSLVRIRATSERILATASIGNA